MKFKEYLEKLNRIAKEHPEILDYEVIEQLESGYYNCSRNPEIGQYNAENYEFSPTWKGQPANAVCIN